MSFTKGLAGMIGGLVIYVLAGLLFGSAQFVAPPLAALFMWIAVGGLALVVLAPVYFWVGAPLYDRYRGRANA